ncbi:MAG TPA: hypothetical protein VJS64_06665 [Pyrinomonadaceae bacterium]|nr:hypothetical protein [Pyrinomonadaceae bacterium]
MKRCLFSLLMLLLSIAALAKPVNMELQDARPTAQIEAHYDREKNKTTVRLAPVQISGEKAQYHSVHIAPSFSYPGQTFRTPELIDFEVQTVVKTKLKIDLYVVFLVDGETIFLSSNRWAVKRPVPGKRWIGERLVFRMPYETLLKITKAKNVEIKMDGLKFPFNEPVLEQVREFALRNVE